ncbi:erythromycin esterase family protein [Oceanirhabdus sp. W0125-5]|uniref:erythromycin esterase family protein n=1 Tax=Oceanirhabdus sp. W0125-5 TaxID=2999116 RepID=UPI0022F2B42A|nr:erythromycin esterase family protein [Oceanirhabdus sp. W0125-5]WBW96287.1 erythromycin esterase family protein [Oceanirhabdus sp. W0125-5]
MFKNRVLAGVVILSIILLSFTGCSGNTVSSDTLKSYLQEVSEISIPDGVSIVGLGEATHGNKEFVQLKKDVFSILVKNYGYKVFALEGDFGGCQVVNNYIMNGTGTAEEAVKEIGFAIYKTQEMVDLVEWIKEYNTSVSDEEKLRFYGFDMQRYDNNKAGLMSYIKKVDSEKYSDYDTSLADLNDETVFNQEEKKIKKGLKAIENIMSEMEQNKDSYITKSSQSEFDMAYQYALCIKENAILRGTNVNYSEVRDRFMAQKVQWILAYEESQGNEKLFIAGHNGHIEKSSASLVGYTSMGQRLKEAYKEKYFAIGTEFYENKFLCRDGSSGERVEFSIKNNTNDLIKMYEEIDKEISFLDIRRAEENKELKKLLSSKQSMGNIGDEFSSMSKVIKSGYTISMIPKDAYNAIIFVKNATPTTMLK